MHREVRGEHHNVVLFRERKRHRCFFYNMNRCSTQEKVIKIQKDKSLDKSVISGTFIKTVRDVTAQKINRQKSPLAFFIS
jgi:hypothetical protein